MKIIYILLAFTILPIIELSLLLLIHSNTSFWFTIGLILCTGIIGSILAKRQGTANLKKIKDTFKQGQLPGEELLHGLMILIAGALLITPGVLTDILGFLLLTPGFRRIVAKRVTEKIKGKIKTQTSFSFSHNSSQQQYYGQANDDDIIDIEGQDTTEPSENTGPRLSQ